jgi:hypothetical protein
VDPGLVFPRDNAFSQRVHGLPVAAGSTATVAAIGAGEPVHADFGSGTLAALRRLTGADFEVVDTSSLRR